MNDESRILGGRYRVGKLIGRGGMGDVHLGTDTRLGRTVAIKILRSQLTEDEDFRRRFRQEAQSAARMNHPNIVRTYDTGEDESIDASGETVVVPYIVMEYVEGKTVRDFVKSGALTVNDSVRIISDVLAALEYAHASGLVHRDIKPGNVMVSVSGFVKVMDFGVAKAVADSSATVAMTAHILGTATYFSPEQAKGESVDSRSDLYSAGVMLYEMLTGRPPFQGDSPTAVAYQHVNHAPIPPTELNPEVSDALSRVTLAALAKSPSARYQSARQFSDDLLAAAAGREPRTATALLSAATADALSDTVLIPRQKPLAEMDFESLLAGSTPTATAPVSTAVDTESDERQPQSRARKALPWLAVGALAIAAVISLVWFLNLKGSVNASDYTVTMVDVTGKSSAEAQSTLSALGVKFTLTQAASSTVASGSVISTDPAAGATVSKATTTVTVVVSTGAAQIEVPSLTGFTVDSAKEKLTELGLTVGEITSKDKAGYAENVVISTSPASSTSVSQGSAVDIVIATGKVKLPNLVGKSITTATNKLKALNLSVSAQPEAVCDGVDGEVTYQSPSAGRISQSVQVTLQYNLVDSSQCDTSSDSASPSAPSN